MAVEIVVPEVGESGMDVIFQGWLKQAGEDVAVGEPLFELDTDKSMIEVEAFADGILADLRVAEGDVVQPRQVVGLLLAPGEPLPEPARDAPARDAPAPESRPERTPDPERVARAAGDRVRAMPRAKVLAQERGIDLSTLTGTGPHGAISVSDVEAAPAGNESGGAGSRRERVRRATAELTSASWRTIPHFHLTLEADVTDSLERLRPVVAICRALAVALERHPECNLEWRDDVLTQRTSVDLGILVDTPQGLLLPAVRDAAALSAADLGDAIADAADRARTGALRPEDREPRSASVSNLGMFSVDAFAGVIPVPDVLLLSAGRTRTVARWSEREWVPRSVATLTLSVDHRALDGADGARLLGTVEALLGGVEVLT